MISWWPGDGDGNDIQDGNDLSLGSTTFAPGKVNQAFSFNGSGFADAGRPTNLINIGGQVTLDGWINPSNTNDANYFGKSESSGNDYAVLCIFGTPCQVIAITKTGGTEHEINTGYFPPVNAWTHVALTYDGSTMTVYANGVNVGSTPVSGTIDDSGESFTIGGRSGSLFFSGLIDEVEVFNRGLSQAEILSIYNAGCTGKCRSCVTPPAGMISWWPGDGNADDIVDVNDGALQGGATFATGEVAQAFSFTNNGDAVDVPDNANENTGAQVTLDAWIQPSSTLESLSNAHGSIINKRTPGNVQGYTFELDNENTTNGLRFEITTTDGGFGLLVPNATTPDVWQHVAATYDGSTMTIYVNGVSVGTPVSATGTINAVTNDLLIGKNITNGESFPGLIDEVELFGRALTQREVQSIYDVGSAGKCKCVIPLKPGFPPFQVTNDNNDGYSVGRGTVFQDNNGITVLGAALWINPSAADTYTFNLWETTTYPGNVNNNLLATASAALPDNGLGYYDVQFASPVTLTPGTKYHIEVVFNGKILNKISSTSSIKRVIHQ